ncbi:U4/u6.u5 tri-snrnp-associated protein, partial [Globisporangium splendens]
MGRRSRSRSASRSPSRSRRGHASSSSSSSHRRHEDSSSRHRSRSPHHRRASRRRSSSDLDANEKLRKKQKTEATEHAVRDEQPPTALPGDSAVKANTVEKNGEISMSIEETNRVRAALGLKPLSLGPKKKDANVVNLQKTSDQIEEEREREELQRKIAQSKKKRELTQKLAGQSIGEQLKASASSSALDWVKQSRTKVDAVAAAAKKKTQQQTKQAEYDASALAGMVVGHDITSFDEGDEVVLTLKDTRVLAEDGNDLNDEQDELVNVELSERDRRIAEKERAQRAMMPAYSGYDDDEFIQMGGSKRMKKPARLLSQYDEDEDRKASAHAQKFTLDASGSTQMVVDNGNDGNALDDDVTVVSLAMDKTKRVEEYFTQEEIDAQFAKKKGKKLRKKKKLRQKDTAEDDAMASGAGEGTAEDDAAALVQQLEAEALENASKDRGRRRRRVDDDDDDKPSAVEEANLLRFQEARERANVTASNALDAMSGAKKKRRPVVLEDDVLDDSMDMELNASLARTRRLAQLREETSATSEPSTAVATSVSRSEDRIAVLVSQTIGTEPSITTTGANATAVTSKPSGHVFGETLQQLESSDNVVVFNEATDFETRLKNAMEQRTAQFQAATSMETAVARSETASGVAATNARRDVDEEMKGEDNDENDNEEEETKEGEVWGEEQPLVGSGMAATLALLRKTGDLRETRVERQAGRANDARDRNVDQELRIKDGVKLDYRDEFGRLLTKKEAFRMLSYKFHGHEPGKKKKEKRLKQLKEELEAQKMLSGEGSTKMMKVLEKKQKVSQQAHVVLSGGT